eukprot:scaffold30863_cov22-Tisochrysis_lutea.AAC.1
MLGGGGGGGGYYFGGGDGGLLAHHHCFGSQCHQAIQWRLPQSSQHGPTGSEDTLALLAGQSWDWPA